MTRVPIWERIFLPGEIICEALAVSRADCDGTVDGVIVDFRHKDLPPGRWEAPLHWHTWEHPAGRFRDQFSHFVFPFEHDKDDACLTEQIHGPPELSQPIRVNRGDRITVDRVVTINLPDRDFDDDDEKSLKHVFLKVTRPDGTVEHAPSPLVFMGSTNTRDAPWIAGHMGPSGLREAILYESYARRIERNAADFLECDNIVVADPEHRHHAVTHLAQTDGYLDKLLRLLEEAANERTDEFVTLSLALARADLIKLAANAMQAGFALARHEMLKAEPAARAVRHNQKLAADVTTDKAARNFGRPLIEGGESRTAVAKKIAEMRGKKGDLNTIRALQTTLETVDPKHRRYQPFGG